ncbi:MAG TPA: sn-glycerol-3-phosphate ABC transporter ATP-binding protein UgpC [Acidimicrobiales bacterium]|jgi:multiple sugar transport system ATP-binding protein|nr:sn-glycerol-3-phosphate ABC transporter ATP-binding protein UgpC [Acidimicrobiales bacterium]
MASINLEGVRKVYPNGYEAIKELDLNINDGEFMVVVGPSGCGKTTVLRMIAGLESVSAGTVRIGDDVVNDVTPRDRDIAMIFQSYALYPNMNVAQNIGFALRMKKLSKDEIDAKVKAAAKVLGISDWLGQKPSQLSGGQRQRVAMGRAIVREPRAFLMDEPLSNLDAKLRVQMRAEVARVQKRIGVATLYVTHDQTEAMTLGHRVAVLRSGVLQQCDAPQVLYDRPANIFVAGFIGSPAMNLLEGALLNDAQTVKLGSQEFTLSSEALQLRPGLKRFAGRSIVIGIRPEDLSIASGETTKASIDGEIELVEALGSELLIHFQADARVVRAEGGVIAEGAELGDSQDEEEKPAFVARVAPRLRALAGERVRFEFATERLEFFDYETGIAVND